jgi:hypothetical protein
MAWTVLPFSTASPTGAAVVNDSIVTALEWDDQLNTLLGSAFAPLHQPLPAARGTLDDETVNTTAHGYLAGAPTVGGGRRAAEWRRHLQYQAVLHIDYQQNTAFAPLWDNQVLPPIAARGDQSLQPVWNARDLLQRKFQATTTQDGLRWMHPSLMPVAVYGDDVCRVLSEVQRHLLEPIIDGGVSWQLWTQTEVEQALLLRLNRFLLETGIVRKEATYTAGAFDGTTTVDQDVLEIRRVQWRYSDYRKRPRNLMRIDTKQADQGHVDWDEVNEAQEPYAYIEDPSHESMMIRACPLPDDNGQLGVRYVPYATVNFAGCGRLPIPRMFTWVVKWGLIADLLKKEGEANDPLRASAAEEIYRNGIGLVKALLGTEV